ncbi:MAG TPA: hypothetical protein VNS79_03635 [Sphingobium sp.]|nr:hypothetical protein [Sphingobium sp.]
MGVPLIGEIVFDMNRNGIFPDTENGVDDLFAATSRKGEYGPGVKDWYGFTSPVDPSAYPTMISGTSTSTGFYYGGIIPPTNARIASPATALLGHDHTATLLKNAGLNMTPSELRNFDTFVEFDSADAAKRERARQIAALNLKLLLHAGYETYEPVTGVIVLHDKIDHVRQQLKAGAVDFNNVESMVAVLNRSKYAITDSRGKRDAAELIARFGKAVDQYLTGPESISAIEYGMRILILPELEWILFQHPSGPNLVEDISVNKIIDVFRFFEDAPDINNVDAKFIAVADYIDFNANEEINITPYHIVSNDRTIEHGPVLYTDKAVLSVKVPNRFSSVLSAFLEKDGSVTVKRTGAEQALGWFEYTSRDQSGVTSSSRVYLHLKPGR